MTYTETLKGMRIQQRSKGMQPVIKQEADLEGKVAFLIKVLKFIIRSAGFELVGRIVIKDKETGKVFR